MEATAIVLDTPVAELSGIANAKPDLSIQPVDWKAPKAELYDFAIEIAASTSVKPNPYQL
ncbi:hypothetical protein D3C72_2135480 [compost metagenome]